MSVASRRFGSELRIEVYDNRPRHTRQGFVGDTRRLSAGRSKSDGRFGLWLFLVKHAADLLGHRIEVRSDEGVRLVLQHSSVKRRLPAG